jgi:hypothetical protein
MNKKHFRQGDILLLAINKIPAGAAALQRPERAIVLGEGETAGHRHELLELDKVQAYKLSEGFYIDVAGETALIHPEHEQVALLPGSYQVIRQSEFQRKEIVRVQD